MISRIPIYSIALFLHIVGALGIFVALGLEWASLLNLRRAETGEQGRLWLKLYTSLSRLYPLSWLLILIPGFYMTAVAWRGAAWISVALVAVVLLAVLGAALGGRQMAPIRQALSAQGGPLSAPTRDQINNPLLWSSLWIRTGIALGIVFLMVVKPGLSGALISLGVAIILAWVLSLPARRREREQMQDRKAEDSV